jgi:tetratricopeptide (TPR) repeat protein
MIVKIKSKRSNSGRFMTKPIVLTILVFMLAGCDNYLTYKNKPVSENDLLINERLEAGSPNLKPMYGNEIKSSEEIAADNRYVSEMLHLHNGDTVEAAKESARIGWYYFYKGVMDTAMYRFNQGWLIDRNYPASYFGFAAIREYQGIKSEAEKYYRLAYKHDPSDSLTNKYLHEIAEIKESQKDTSGLIIAYHRVLSILPKDAVATGKLGFFYSVINRPDSALKYYNLTIKFDPTYEQTYVNRGWYYFQIHKTKEAIADYTTAISINTKSITAFANRANALISDKQYIKAITDIKQCILLEPKYPNFHGALAECYFQLGQNDKGCEELNIGLQKGGQFADVKKQHGCE